MKLIENPRAAIKHYSTLALAGISSATATYLALPAAVQAMVPYGDKAVLFGMLATAALGLIGKFVDQSEVKP